MIKWRAVSSGMVSRVAFSTEFKGLAHPEIAIEYHTGDVWLYPGTEEEYKQMLDDSVGQYAHNTLKPRGGRKHKGAR
jgi:hypothetical protein